MGHKHNLRHKKKRKEGQPHSGSGATKVSEQPHLEKPKLEIVLKCGSDGIRQVLENAVAETVVPGVGIVIVHSGIGEVSKSDVFLAETFGRLVLGFEVGTNPHLEEQVLDSGVEVRLYDVIYRLTDDLRSTAESLLPNDPEEQVLGRAKPRHHGAEGLTDSLCQRSGQGAQALHEPCQVAHGGR